MADGSVIIDSKLDSSGLEKGLQGLGGIASKGFGAITSGIAAVSAGLVAAGGFAASVGSQFDSAMSQVAATMGTTVDQIGILSDVAKEMGATTAFSATEAAQALNYLALAGYDAATATDTLPAVLNLAAAGGMDLAYASDLATDAMSALGIEASKANLSAFGDELAMTASKANTSVAQLGEAILTVGGTAKTLAGGTKELNTALGVLANRGIKGAEGGTHLRNIILALTAPTDKAAKAIKALGVSATDSAGNMRPLNEVLADLDKAMAGMTDAQKTEALNEIFNKTDIAAVQGLIAGCGDEWNNLAAAIGNAGGAMEQMANTQLDNLEGDITIFRSALEGLGIAAYEGFRAPLRNIVQLGTSMIDELSSAMKSGGYEGLASAFGDVVARAIDAATGYLPSIMQLSVKVIKGFCNGLKKNAKQIAGTLKDVLATAVSGVAESFPALLEAGMQIAAELLNGMAEALPTLIPKLIEGIGGAIAAIASNAGALIQAGIAIVQGILVGIVSALPALVQSMFDAISGLWDSLTRLFKGEPPKTKVNVDAKEAREDVAGLKLDLDNLPESVTVKTIVTQTGAIATAVLLQSVVNKDGTTINVYAVCDENGNVQEFQREVVDLDGNTVSVEAKVPKEGEGSVTFAQNEINGIKAPECVINIGFDSNGNPKTIQAEINGIKGTTVNIAYTVSGSPGVLIANLQALEKKGVKITTTFDENGSTEKLVQLQSFVDEHGNTVQIFAKCDPTGQVQGFIRTVNNIKVNDVPISAVSDDGSIDLVQTELNGIKVPPCGVTLYFNENGNPVGIQTQINGIQGKSVEIVGSWNRGDIPTEVDVDVVLSDSKNTRTTIESEIDGFKSKYASEAIQVQIQFKKANELVSQLDTIQRKLGSANRNAASLADKENTLSGMGKSLESIATGVLGMIDTGSVMFKPETKSNWEGCASALSSIATSADGLEAKLSGLSSVEFTEPENLQQTSRDAALLATALRNGANELRDLATNTNALNKDKAEQLNTWASELENMANNADTLATKLAEIKPGEVLDPADVAQLQEVTQALVQLYPQLADYVGENGILNLEAAQVQALIEQYRQLALEKAASTYVERAAESLGSLQFEQQLVAATIQALQEKRAALLASREQWAGLSATISGLQDPLANVAQGLNILGDDFDISNVSGGLESVETALQILQQYADETGGDLSALGDLDLSTITEDGEFLSAEAILSAENGAEAVTTLANAMQLLKNASSGEVSSIDTELTKNAQAASEAQKEFDNLAPAIARAESEMEKAIGVAQGLQDKYGAASDAINECKDALNGGGDSAEETADTMGEAGEAAGEAAEEFSDASKDIEQASGTADKTVADLTHGADEVAEAASSIEETVSKLTESQTAADALKQQIQALPTEAQTAYESLEETATNMTLLAAAMIEAIKGALTTSEDELNATGKTIIDGIKTGITNNAVQSEFQESANAVYTAARNALTTAVGTSGSKFKDIGKNICRGLADGIKDGTGMVVDAAYALADAVYGALCDGLQVNSPSKLMANTVGPAIPEGVALGMDKHVDFVENSAQRLIDAAVEKSELGLSYWSEALKNAADERSTMPLSSVADSLAGVDYDAMADAIWEHRPEGFDSVNQTVNFNQPIQAPDEVAREIRMKNNLKLIGGKS